jgi:hypothetical protein
MSFQATLHTCLDCAHSFVVGYEDARRGSSVFCAACHEGFSLRAEPGEGPLTSPCVHQLWMTRRQSSIRTSGKLRRGGGDPIDTGVRVPVVEDLVQVGEKLHLVHLPALVGLTCPLCHVEGKLMRAEEYGRVCRRCGGARWSHETL